MDRIEFDVKVEEEGCIRIPSEFAGESVKGKVVHVVVSDKKERATVKLMREQPGKSKDFTPIKRDDLYER